MGAKDATKNKSSPRRRGEKKRMSNVVQLLWFVKEVPEGEEDIELLIGVYSSKDEAKAAIERAKDQKGFIDYPQDFRFARTS